MQIESSLQPFEEQAPKLLQEDTLEGYELKTNSFPTKELEFDLTSPVLKMEKLILTNDEDKKGVLATMDEGLKRSSRTFLMSLAGL